MIKSLDDVSNAAHHLWIFYNYDIQSFAKKILLHLWEDMITLVRSLLGVQEIWGWFDWQLQIFTLLQGDHEELFCLHLVAPQTFLCTVTVLQALGLLEWNPNPTDDCLVLSYLAISNCNDTQYLDMDKSALLQLFLLLATWKQMPQINNYSMW